MADEAVVLRCHDDKQGAPADFALVECAVLPRIERCRSVVAGQEERSRRKFEIARKVAGKAEARQGDFVSGAVGQRFAPPFGDVGRADDGVAAKRHARNGRVSDLQNILIE